MHIHDTVLHDLLCSSLRDTYHGRVDSEVVEIFIYELGVALHNVPHHLRETGTIPFFICMPRDELIR